MRKPNNPFNPIKPKPKTISSMLGTGKPTLVKPALNVKPTSVVKPVLNVRPTRPARPKRPSMPGKKLIKRKKR